MACLPSLVDLALIKLTALLLALALAHAPQDGKDQPAETRRIPELGNPLRVVPVFHKSSLREVDGAYVLAMRKLEVIETGFGLVQ